MLVVVIAIGMCLAYKKDRNRRREHNELRRTRSAVYNRRSMRNLQVEPTPAQDFETQINYVSSQSPKTTNPTRAKKISSNFHIQTVLPDKSNVNVESLREDGGATTDDEGDDNGSVIDYEKNRANNNDGSGGGRRNMTTSMSMRDMVSTWRRPTVINDECCICLQGMVKVVVVFLGMLMF